MMPTPNNATPNSKPIVKAVGDPIFWQPGKWYALVEINADPTATAQEVRDAICDNLMIDLYEGEEHPLQSASVLVDKRFGLHPDEGTSRR